MAVDATGTPTSPDSIPTLNTTADNPSGKGFNAAMAAIQTALSARISKPASLAAGEVPVWNGTTWVRSTTTNIGPTSLGTGTPDSTNFLRGDGTWQTAGVTDQVINTQSGTSYTLALTDKNKLLQMTSASTVTVTIPTNASVAFPVGAALDVVQWGAGQVQFAVAGGVSCGFNPGAKMVGQYGVATLVKLATDTWLLCGALTP